MAYETGTASSTNDLLDKLRVFLTVTIDASIRWTQNGWADDTKVYTGSPPSSGKRLHISKGDVYINLRSSSDTCSPFQETYRANPTGESICMNGSTGYNAGNEWDDQTGHIENNDLESTGVHVFGFSGTFTYHFFAHENTVIASLERASGEWFHLIFGQIVKDVSFTGGMFFTANLWIYDTVSQPWDYKYNGNWPTGTPFRNPYTGGGYVGYNTAMYIDNLDSKTDWWCGGYNGGHSRTDRYLYTTAFSCDNDIKGLNNLLRIASPNEYNGLEALFPIYFFAYRSPYSGYSRIGYVQGVRQLNMFNRSPGDEITYGGDTWKIFPLSDISLGNYYGFAFLK